MATYNPSVLTPTSLTVTGLNTLASATYVASAEIDHTVSNEPDRLIEVEITTTNTPTGNKQIIVFAKGSIDGTDFSSGPESGTTATDESDLYFLGVVPMNSSATTHRRLFSLASAFGGRLPAKSKLVFKNDMGVAVTSAAVTTAICVDTIA